jgi:hypothetical protein
LMQGPAHQLQAVNLGVAELVRVRVFLKSHDFSYSHLIR